MIIALGGVFLEYMQILWFRGLVLNPAGTVDINFKSNIIIKLAVAFLNDKHIS